jgi:hypothetical protein
MADLLVEAKGAVEETLGSGRDGLNAYELMVLRSRYTKIVKRGLATLPEKHSPGTADREAFNLLRRFELQRHEVTRYWSDARVSPDNNQAERDLRMVKLSEDFRLLSNGGRRQGLLRCPQLYPHRSKARCRAPRTPGAPLQRRAVDATGRVIALTAPVPEQLPAEGVPCKSNLNRAMSTNSAHATACSV